MRRVRPWMLWAGLALASACADAPLGPGPEAPPGGPWASVAVGGAHACAIDGAGRLACWGSNGSDQLGFDGDGVWSAPRFLPDEGPWTAVAAGGRHTCAVHADGGLWCWGANDAGQLGDAGAGPWGLGDRAAPGRVEMGGRFRAVSAGESHTCAVSDADDLVCWGDSSAGQAAGDGASLPVIPPTLVAGGPWSSVVAGSRHTCALTRAGVSYCWGSNAAGEVGAAVQFAPRLAASRVGGSVRLRTLAVGTAVSCGIDDQARVLCWGDNAARQASPSGVRHGSPVLRAPGPASAVGVGDGWVCAAGEMDGEVTCWGARWDVPEAGGPTVDPEGWLAPASHPRSFSVGDRHACAVSREGSLTCWGSASGGRLGPFGS